MKQNGSVYTTCKLDKGVDWKLFFELKENRNDEYIEVRNSIIEHYIFLLENIAEFMSRKFPASITFDDCRQAGYIGLHKAVESFDTSKNCNFKSYATIRIRGSIIDFIRSMDPLGRQLRGLQRKINTATEKLEKRLERKPNDEELLDELKMTKDEFKEYSKRSANYTTLSLHDECDSDYDKAINRLDLITNKSAINPNDKAVDNEIYDDCMKDFSLKERIVMILYYKELLNLKEIGDILDLSESRVSQIRTKVLKQLYSKNI